jgi:hypothetical protein
MSSVPWLICWPSLTAMLATTPSRAANSTCSIFIASTTASRSPLAMESPTTTNTRATLPLIGARTASPAWPWSISSASYVGQRTSTCSPPQSA